MSDEEMSPWLARLSDYGPVLFWSTMILVPTANLATSIVRMRTARMNLLTELVKIQPK